MIPDFLRRRWAAALDPHTGDVLAGTVVAFVMRPLGRFLLLGFHVVLARLLGAEGAGLYYLALAVSAIGVTAGSLGLPTSSLRFTAVHSSKEEWAQVAGLYRRALRLAALAAAAATLAVFFAAPWIARGIFSEPALTDPLRLMSLSILPTAFLRLHTEFLRGLQRIRDALLGELVGVPLFGLVFLVLLATPYGVQGAAIAQVAGSSLALAWSIRLWRRATPQLRGLEGDFDLRTLLRTSMPVYTVALIGLINGWADTFFLGIWYDTSQVGVYGIAVRLSAIMAALLVIANTAVAPKFAALYAQNEIAELRRLARRTALMASLMALPLLLLFWIFPRFILGLFGAEFQAGAVALMILAAGQFVNVAAGSVGNLLMMSGHEKEYRNLALVSAALSLLLNLLLIPRYGLVGAAVASATTRALMNIGAMILVYRKLSIVTFPFLRVDSAP
ncbi:MAG: oligosaccharide flippase family protein [Acidobacteria bacterium]|nr:oligosaccharide flippase family protein [Acidobacteriota bacterium]